MKKLIFVFAVILVFTLITVVSHAQEQNPYEEFKGVDFFSSIDVLVKGDSAKDIGLNKSELRKYVMLQFNEVFSPKMERPYSLRVIVESTSEADKKRFGSLSFLIWVIGDDYPIPYFIEAKAGNQLHSFWKRYVLKKGLKEEIPGEVKKVIKEFIQELANDFFAVKIKE